MVAVCCPLGERATAHTQVAMLPGSQVLPGSNGLSHYSEMVRCSSRSGGPYTPDMSRELQEHVLP